MEVKKVEKNNNESTNFQSDDAPQDTIMIRVNQTFDQMEQEVKDLINKNTQEVNIK